LRVLHVDTEAGFRGGQRQVLLLCGGLRERGVEATLLAREGGELARAAAAQGIAVTCVRQGVPWDPRPVRRLRWLLRRTPVDLVHAHASHAHGAAVAALATIPAPARPPLVVSRRVDFPLHGPLARRIKYGPLVRRFLAVSRAVAGVLEEGGVPPDRVRVVHSGVPPLPPPDRGRDEVRRALGVAPDRPLLLTTAALVDHKDHATAIRAVARCRAHVRLVIAGEGPLRAALDRPDRVAGLSLIATTPRFVQAADWSCAMAERTFQGFADALDDDASATLLRFLALQVQGAEHAKDTLRLLRAELAERPPASRTGLVQGLDILLRTDLRGALSHIACPVHWLFGARDTLVPRALQAELATLLPAAVIDEIDGAGHAPFLSHPQASVAALLAAAGGKAAP